MGDNLRPSESLVGAAMPLALPDLAGELRRIMEIINLELPDQPSRMIVITGAQSGVGTSTIACWLSAALATAYLGDILYLNACPGFSPLTDSAGTVDALGLLELVRDPNWSDAIYQKTAIPNLLTMRAWTSRTADMIQITDQLVAQAMAMLKKRFAYVLVDAPTPLVSPLTMTLARHCGGTLIVIEANKTDRELVAETGALLRHSGARIIGAVVNKGSMR